MDTFELQKFLQTAKIPRIKKKPKTFLGIAKQPHYENVLSNIYAFYFDVHEVHRLHDLFIKSLLELLPDKQKTTLNGFVDFYCDTEYPTKDGGRIDLLLSNEEQAIIIENKVYHHLDNDLFDYWKAVKVSENNKVGIVLSLHPVSDIKHPNFINKTHLELLKKVVHNLGNYLLDANDKYIVFLKDMFQNITNLSRSYMEEKDLKFYFDNKTKIEQAAKFKFAVRDHIIAEIETAGKILDGIDLYVPKKSSVLNKRARYFQSQVYKNLVIVVVFENIMEQNTFFMGVEFKGGGLNNKERYRAIDFTPDEEALIEKTGFYANTNMNWAHFAGDHYPVTEHDIATLSTFIINKLKSENLLSIFNKLNAFLKAEKPVALNQN